MLAVVLASAVAAPAAADFGTVQKLLHERRYDEAADLGESLGKTPEVRAENRAFVEALALKHQGRNKEAAEAFRTLLARNPRFDRVRAELAHTLFLLGDDKASRHHFELLSASARSPTHRGAYDRFLTALDSRKPWVLDGYLTLAPSTNISQGVNGDIVTIGGVPFAGATKKESGLGAGFGVNGARRWTLMSPLSVAVGGGLSGTIYDDSDYDFLCAQSFVELAYDKAPWRFGIGAGADKNYEGWEGASWGVGPQASLRRSFGRYGTALATLAWRERDYDEDDVRDGEEIAAALRYNYALSNRTMLIAGLAYSDVSAELDLHGYNRYRPSIEIYHELPYGLVVDGSLAYERRDYKDDYFLMPEPRKDERIDVTAGVTFRDLAMHGVAPRLEYSYRLQESNVDLYDMDAHTVGISLTTRY